jgi:excisionase family DNA binding protein
MATTIEKEKFEIAGGLEVPERMEDVKFYSLREVGTILGVTYRTIQNYVWSGRLKATKPGGQWRVAEKDFRLFMAGGEGERFEVEQVGTAERAS